MTLGFTSIYRSAISCQFLLPLYNNYMSLTAYILKMRGDHADGLKASQKGGWHNSRSTVSIENVAIL